VDPYLQMEQTEDDPRAREKPEVAGLKNWLASVDEVGELGWAETLERQGMQET